MTRFQYGRSLNPCTGAVALALSLILSACGGGGGDGSGSTTAPTPSDGPPFAYVANQGGGVSVYDIDISTGVLTRIDADPVTGGVQDVPAGTSSQSVAVDPLGQFAYVANAISDDVSAYTIDASTGALTPIDADPVAAGIQYFPAGISPESVTVDPSGKFAYVANAGSDDVSAYTLDAGTGALTPVDADPLTVGIQNVPAGRFPQSVTVNPSGQFAYVANLNSGVSAYIIDAGTGALTRIDADPLAGGVQNFPAGDRPASVSIDPSGQFAYVANQTSNDVSAYTIDAGTGALTRIDADPLAGGVQDVPAGNNPQSVAVDPLGQFAYVANVVSDDVSAYTIDASTGALTPIDADPVAAGIQYFPAGISPVSVAVDPSGKFAYVANFNSFDVSAYTIDAGTGALTQILCGSGAGCSIFISDNFSAGSNPRAVTTTQ